MPELWDIYDENKNKTGRTAIRDVTILQKGEYHIVVTGIILNSKNEILISKRATNKKFGGMWECNGGSILAGETSKEGILRELKEELGVNITEDECKLVKSYLKNRLGMIWDIYFLSKDVELEDVTLQKEEVSRVKLVNTDEFRDMLKEGIMCEYSEVYELLDIIDELD